MPAAARPIIHPRKRQETPNVLGPLSTHHQRPPALSPHSQNLVDSLSRAALAHKDADTASPAAADIPDPSLEQPEWAVEPTTTRPPPTWTTTTNKPATTPTAPTNVNGTNLTTST